MVVEEPIENTVEQISQSEPEVEQVVEVPEVAKEESAEITESLQDEIQDIVIEESQEEEAAVI